MFTPLAFNKESIVTRGLVFHVDAADRTSYSPGSGVWKDLTGNGNDGTLTNGPTFDSGNGGSIVFDGTDDYVESVAIQPIQFTLNCWFKTTGPPSNNDSSGGCLMVADPQFVSAIPWFLSHSYSNQRIVFIVENNLTLASTADNSAPNNQIHLVSATYDGTVGSVYLNGQFLTSRSFNSPTYNTSGNINVQIGRWGYPNFERRFNGHIYNTSIYNRALTPSEISQNYNALKGRFGL